MKKLTLITLIITPILIFNCSQEPSKKPIKIGYLPIAECLPLYVAKEKGFFEKYGLQVELVSITGGPKVFKELKAGSISIGFSNVVTLIQYTNSGENFKTIFGATYETPLNVNHAIFKRKGYSDSAMAKSKFGINAKSNIEELMLINYLEQRQISVNDELRRNFVEFPFSQLLPSLREGTIDYACIVEPFISIALKDTASFELVGNHYANSSNLRLVATYVASDVFINNEPEQLQAFISAMKDATDYINNNEIESRQDLARYSKVERTMINEIGLPKFSDTIDSGQLDSVIDLMYKLRSKNTSFILNPEKRTRSRDMIMINK